MVTISFLPATLWLCGLRGRVALKTAPPQAGCRLPSRQLGVTLAGFCWNIGIDRDEDSE